MPTMNELVDNIALSISGITLDPLCFSRIELRFAYSQLALSKKPVGKAISV